MGEYVRTLSKSYFWGVDFLILVTLGTQDKSFDRLLKQIDNEIEKGTIKERVVVQAGYTKYNSNNMEIFDLVPSDMLESLANEARIIITHGGVGSILMGIKKGKVVIAAPRLKRYKEHTNDHQKQIIEEFSRRGYILELRDFDKLGKLIAKADNFRPKKFVSNTQNMVKLVDSYIEESNHISWYNRTKEILWYGFFGVLTTFVNIISFDLLDKCGLNTYFANFIAWFLSVLFAFITNKLFVFGEKSNNTLVFFKSLCSFFFFRILSLGIDMAGLFVCLNYFHLTKMISKVLMNVVVIVANYVFSKLFVFNKSK